MTPGIRKSMVNTPPGDAAYERSLVKFLMVSSLSLFIGTVHGMLQVMPPIRAWLDSIGSPFGGPGHMIDPLAHAHVNLVGGVVMLVVGATYYLLPRLLGRPIFSVRLVGYSFWLITIGVFCFYTVEMTFGIWEGMLYLDDPGAVPHIHHYYGHLVATGATIMALGFASYFTNVACTVLGVGRRA
jgi:cytochrome c oxidase cbb3-type subunit 1